MKYTFVIPVYNDNRVHDSINSFINAHNSRENECIVVCNGSDQGFYKDIQSKYKQHSNIKVFWADRGNISLARNLGVLKAKGEYVTFIDSDCRFDKDYIDVLNRINSEPDVIRARMRFDEGTTSFEYLCSWLRSSFDSKFINTLYVPHLVVKRGVFDTVGLYNEDLSGSEDTDWSQRFYSYPQFVVEYAPMLILKHGLDNKKKAQLKTWKLYGLGQAYRARKSTVFGTQNYLNAFRKGFGELALIDSKNGIRKNLFVINYIRLKFAGFLYGWFIKWSTYDKEKYKETESYYNSKEYRSRALGTLKNI